MLIILSIKHGIASQPTLRYMDIRLDSIATAPTSPTRYPTQSPDVLVIAIIKASGLGYHLENLPSELSSDHSPVLLDIHHDSAHVSLPKSLFFTDWQKYKIEMEFKPFILPPLTN